MPYDRYFFLNRQFEALRKDMNMLFMLIVSLSAEDYKEADEIYQEYLTRWKSVEYRKEQKRNKKLLG